MFVKLKKLSVATGGAICALYALGTLGISPAWANEVPNWKMKEGTIPVTVKLQGITETDGPIYVSIQTQENYQSMKGFGGIINDPTAGDMTRTFKVDKPGSYAVSVWHDLDDDGRFSMTEDYKILDGWGASGDAPDDREPTFDDVQIKVDESGANVSVDMRYPG
ncbi:DUF2141 domain-containing protein [Litorimonas sp.]|uniref:DUF2141 domain-containing protein n=1 Tax=Litorimonas sp. TaxID=1892381 RepID=UPI003A84D11D